MRRPRGFPIDLDPNEAHAFAALSDIAVLAGRVGEGLEHIAKAFRLNPYPDAGTIWRAARRNMRPNNTKPLSRRYAGTEPI